MFDSLNSTLLQFAAQKPAHSRQWEKREGELHQKLQELTRGTTPGTGEERDQAITEFVQHTTSAYPDHPLVRLLSSAVIHGQGAVEQNLAKTGGGQWRGQILWSHDFPRHAKKSLGGQPYYLTVSPASAGNPAHVKTVVVDPTDSAKSWYAVTPVHSRREWEFLTHKLNRGARENLADKMGPLPEKSDRDLAGAADREVDWRPSEAIPEDFYSFSKSDREPSAPIDDLEFLKQEEKDKDKRFHRKAYAVDSQTGRWGYSRFEPKWDYHQEPPGWVWRSRGVSSHFHGPTYPTKEELFAAHGEMPAHSDLHRKPLTPHELWAADLPGGEPPEAPEVDWRPSETIPEDYHTFSALEEAINFAKRPDWLPSLRWGSHRFDGVSHQQLSDWLGKKTERRLDHNKVIHRDPNGQDIHVRLHQTNIVTVHPDGTYTVRSGGYNTPTTRRAISVFTGLAAYSNKGVMHIGGQPLEEGMRVPDLSTVETPEVDYRPTETIPEDYYAFSARESDPYRETVNSEINSLADRLHEKHGVADLDDFKQQDHYGRITRAVGGDEELAADAVTDLLYDKKHINKIERIHKPQTTLLPLFGNYLNFVRARANDKKKKQLRETTFSTLAKDDNTPFDPVDYRSPESESAPYELPTRTQEDNRRWMEKKRSSRIEADPKELVEKVLKKIPAEGISYSKLLANSLMPAAKLKEVLKTAGAVVAVQGGGTKPLQKVFPPGTKVPDDPRVQKWREALKGPQPGESKAALARRLGVHPDNLRKVIATAKKYLGEAQPEQFARKTPVAEMHPELQYTRLGAILREHSQEDTDVGALSRAILASDPKQPLELTPIRALEDYMQENDSHPLAGRFNWAGLADKVALDHSLTEAVTEHNTNKQVGETAVEFAHFTNPPTYDPTDVRGRISKIASNLQQKHGVSLSEINRSAQRLHYRYTFHQLAGDLGYGMADNVDTFHTNVANSDYNYQQDDPQRFAKLLPATEAKTVHGETKFVHEFTDDQDQPLGTLSLVPRGQTLHVDWIGLHGAGSGEQGGVAGAKHIRSLLPQIATTYPNHEFLMGQRAGGAHKGDYRGVELAPHREQVEQFSRPTVNPEEELSFLRAAHDGEREGNFVPSLALADWWDERDSPWGDVVRQHVQNNRKKADFWTDNNLHLGTLNFPGGYVNLRANPKKRTVTANPVFHIEGNDPSGQRSGYYYHGYTTTLPIEWLKKFADAYPENKVHLHAYVNEDLVMHDHKELKEEMKSWFAPEKPEQFARKARPQFHPQHISALGVINPAHITNTVQNLAQQLVDAESTINRGARRTPLMEALDVQPHSQEEVDAAWGTLHSVRPILADALQDAGLTDEPFLAELRGTETQPAPLWSTRREHVIKRLAENNQPHLTRLWKDHLKQFKTEQDHIAAHESVVGKNSDLPLGFVTKVQRDLRGTPQPGEIYYREPYSFNTGRGFRKHVSYQEKRGRPLTAEELRELAKQRRAQKKAEKDAQNRKPPEQPPEQFAAKPSHSEFISALHRVRSQQQNSLRELAALVAKRVGLTPVQIRNAIHDEPTTSSANTSQILQHGGTPDRVRLAAAWYGLLSQSRSLGILHLHPEGPDTLYSLTVKGSGEDIRNSLDKHQIPQRTLIPHEDSSWTVLVLDRQSDQGGRVHAFAQTHGVPVRAARGHAEIIGDSPEASADEDTRAGYRSLIKQLSEGQQSAAVPSQ